MKPIVKHAYKTATGATPLHRVVRWSLLAIGGVAWRHYQKKRQEKKKSS